MVPAGEAAFVHVRKRYRRSDTLTIEDPALAETDDGAAMSLSSETDQVGAAWPDAQMVSFTREVSNGSGRRQSYPVEITSGHERAELSLEADTVTLEPGDTGRLAGEVTLPAHLPTGCAALKLAFQAGSRQTRTGGITRDARSRSVAYRAAQQYAPGGQRRTAVTSLETAGQGVRAGSAAGER